MKMQHREKTRENYSLKKAKRTLWDKSKDFFYEYGARIFFYLGLVLIATLIVSVSPVVPYIASLGILGALVAGTVISAAAYPVSAIMIFIALSGASLMVETWVRSMTEHDFVKEEVDIRHSSIDMSESKPNTFIAFITNHWGKMLVIALCVTAIAGCFFPPLFAPLISAGMLGIPLMGAAIGWQLLATLGLAFLASLTAESILLGITYGLVEFGKYCFGGCYASLQETKIEYMPIDFDYEEPVATNKNVTPENSAPLFAPTLELSDTDDELCDLQANSPFNR